MLCDYGQVLALFDRSLCAQEFKRRLGRPLPADGERLLEELLIPFESGAIDADVFLARVRQALALRDSTEEQAFRLAWCAILWAQEEVVTLLRRVAARPRTVVHIVTNTDPWRLQHASTTLGLGDLFAGCTASFEAGVTAKGHDSTMWSEARRRASITLGVEPALVLGIDDVEANLDHALADGTLDHGIVFSDAANLEQRLMDLGLW